MGLDIVEDMVRIAREEAARAGLGARTGFRLFNMVNEDVPVADVSLMVGVIEYLPRHRLAAEESCRTPRGNCSVIVDTRGPLWRRTLRYGLARMKQFNLYYHPPDRVAAVVTRAGLRGIRAQGRPLLYAFCVSTPGRDALMHRLVLSVDLDEWYHSRRWVDGRQALGVVDNRELFQRLYGADRPAGEIIAPARALLDLFRRHGVGDVLRARRDRAVHPDLVREIALEGHEIASHGLIHVDMRVLGPERFEQNLAQWPIFSSV